MIEVEGRLDRGTVYLAGEAIDGTVTFHHKGRDKIFITSTVFFEPKKRRKILV